jgi:hypothetical protein
MFAKLVAAAAVVVLSTIVAFANPVGRFAVAGTNPGGQGGYSGRVNVEKTGDTYRVTWDIGSTTYVGTGIGSRDFLAVSYRAGGESGLALYAQQADGSWQGVWTYSDGRTIGTERWSPR